MRQKCSAKFERVARYCALRLLICAYCCGLCASSLAAQCSGCSFAYSSSLCAANQSHLFSFSFFSLYVYVSFVRSLHRSFALSARCAQSFFFVAVGSLHEFLWSVCRRPNLYVYLKLSKNLDNNKSIDNSQVFIQQTFNLNLQRTKKNNPLELAY